MDAYGAVQTSLPWAEFQPALVTVNPEPLPAIQGYFPEVQVYAYNLNIERYDTEPRRGWYMAEGKDVLEALEDAFQHYPGLRESYQNLLTFVIVR